MTRTTQKFWDCNCDRNFIHPYYCMACPICGAVAEDQPEAHESEIGAEELMAPDYVSFFENGGVLQVLRLCREIEEGDPQKIANEYLKTKELVK